MVAGNHDLYRMANCMAIRMRPPLTCPETTDPVCLCAMLCKCKYRQIIAGCQPPETATRTARVSEGKPALAQYGVRGQYISDKHVVAGAAGLAPVI